MSYENLQLRPGVMQHRLEFLKSTHVPDGAGGNRIAFAPFVPKPLRMWAQFLTGGDTEGTTAGQTGQTERLTFAIWFVKNLSTEYRVRYQQLDYEIESLVDPTREKKILILKLRSPSRP